jgi:PAS domain S-box-containing protein
MDPGSVAAIWPHLATLALLAALGLYSWHQRRVPGALPFVVACLLAFVLMVGAAGESVALDPAVKVAWFKFQAAWQLPAITAITCFVLDYANPGRWLTRRTLIVLAVAPLLELVLLLTNDLHHWHWLSFSVGASVVPMRGPAFWVLFAYSLGLMLVNLIAFVWLLIRSPRHRLPVALMLIGNLTGRSLNALEVAGRQAILGWDPLLPSIVIPFGIYAVALFGFRIFDPVPAAGRAAVEQMREGMVVFDAGWRALSVNPAAAGILGFSAAHARGKTWDELLPSCPDASRCLGKGKIPIEVSLGDDDASVRAGVEARRYTLLLTPLLDHRALTEGYLLLLHDVTEQRRAQAQVVEQQRALAMLHEREHLARELHDSIGQVLGFASLKTGATRKLIADGKLARADEQLAHLESIMADAHADVREYILDLRTAPTEQRPFFASLQHYLAGFRQNHGIQVDLSVGLGVDDDLLPPEAQVQVFRIIQEAFSNVRRHAATDGVQLSFEREHGLVRVCVRDNGQGFDQQRPAGEDESHFGLRFMCERAEQLGGTLRVESAPGRGTCVTVEVPVGSNTP